METLMKSDWKDLFEKAGIRKGSRVLLQWGDPHVHTAGGLVTVLEALMELVSEAGTILIPAFTNTCLDPFCENALSCPFELSTTYRHSLHGYEAAVSEAEPMSLTLMRLGGRRSEHPCCSYVIWGTYDPDWLKQPLDYPVSHCLAYSGRTSDVNLLIGKDPADSLVVQALCHEAGKDVSYTAKGAFYRPRRNLTRTWLMSKVQDSVLEEALELVRITEPVKGMKALQLFTSVKKTVEVWKRTT